MSIPLSRPYLEELIFGAKGGKRYTQDSPVLPDVWLEFGNAPLSQHDLLLTPHLNTEAGKLGQVLRKRFSQFQPVSGQPHLPKKRLRTAAIASIQGNVAIKLYFDELIQLVLPMTLWWQKYVAQNLQRYRAPVSPETMAELVTDIENFPSGRRQDSLHFLWLLQLVGAIAWAQQVKAKPRGQQDTRPAAAELAPAGLALLTAVPTATKEQTLIWLINRNRPATLAVHRSTLAVKADAARRLFDVNCQDITWAVIDSGIDATHPAFQDHSKPGASRVIAAYDFSHVRELLVADNLTEGALTKKWPNLAKAFADPDKGKVLRQQLQTLKRDLNTGREVDWELLKPFLEALVDGESEGWDASGHGTHVAGILAADWRNYDSQTDESEPAPADPATGVRRQGMCPDIRLYDLRVFDKEGQGDEFNVIAALQFIRRLNAQRDYIVIHGANLSLSIQHDVANYACGCTPVCEECERLVAAGVVVVAAAGNQGYLRYQTERGLVDGYHTVSITDPGNAESVITVGATHRYQVHTYGVSYFSSRGPTGDGRRKPDLVAPGEKIRAPVPGGVDAFKDGASMAAPHVSGAAAMLMARHIELRGQPGRIKRILCESATDLGREPYFQGFGMLDVLRALQAV